MMKVYPAYKDSGVEWLGQIPEHWQVLPNRALFAEVIDRGSPEETMLSVTISKGVITQADLLAGSSKKDSSNEDKAHYKLVQPGDIAYNKMRAWQGAIGFSHYRGIVSPAYIIVRPRLTWRGGEGFGVNGAYFHYLMRTPAFAKEAERWSYGITSDQWSLRANDFKQIYCALPPVNEQNKIVQYAVDTDIRINRVIQAKRRLIELLNEQKQAVIWQAVTRGLDLNVRLKPSGIRSLGDIPEHWRVVRLRTLVERIDQGISPQAEAILADERSWGVLKAGCVNRGLFRETEHKRLPPSVPIDPTIVVRVGDILVSRASGSPKLVGSVGRVNALNYRLILSDKTFRLVPKEPFSPDFLVAAMNTRYFRNQIEQAISGAEGLANNLPLSALRDFKIAVAPTAEAEEITRFLRTDVAKIDGRIASLTKEVELIREYRTRLIADVVTGKIDVRNIRLPELASTLEYISEEIDSEEILGEVEGEEEAEDADD